MNLSLVYINSPVILIKSAEWFNFDFLTLLVE